jgi:hypothetical protein
MAVLGISYVAVWSKDLTQNRNLFANILELPISYEDEDIVVFETDGAQLVLQRAKGPDEHLDGTVQFGFNVSKLDEITDALKAGGNNIELDREDLGMQQRVTAVRLSSGQSVEFIGD